MKKKDYIYIGIIIILTVVLIIQLKHKESCEKICLDMLKEISNSSTEI
jgi:surface polysaccharide O-acyltransferase-like enzyme